MSVEQDISKLLDEQLAILESEITRNIVSSGKSATGKTVKSLSHKVSGYHGELDGAPWTFSLEKGAAQLGVAALTVHFLRG